MSKIISFKKLEHFCPNSGSGTGYSEPDKFLIEFDDGRKKEVWIDIWYRPIDSIKSEFNKCVTHIKDVDNIEEAWKMYVSEIAQTSCPWTEKEIFRAYQLSNPLW